MHRFTERGQKASSPHFSTLCDTVLSLDSSWSKCSLWTSLFMKTSASKADRGPTGLCCSTLRLLHKTPTFAS